MTAASAAAATAVAPPPTSAPSSVLSVAPAVALALARASPPAVLLDARTPALYELERLRGALQHAPPHIPSRIVIVYDSGSDRLPQPLRPTTRALCALLRLAEQRPTGFALALLAGGLPAAAALDADAVTRLDRAALQRVVRVLGAAGRRRLAAGVRAHFGAALLPPAQVLPWLYVGSARFASAPFLRAKRVSHVLCVSHEHARAGGASAEAASLGVHWHALHMHDRADYDIRQHFARVVALLTHVKAAHGVLLLHCVAGVSRSVACVLAFLLWQGYRLADAWALVSAARSCAAPNDGFWTQLRRWEAELAHMRACEPCAARFRAELLALRRLYMTAALDAPHVDGDGDSDSDSDCDCDCDSDA